MTRRIPPHYLYLIPGIFFAALGAFDIGADLFHHKLYWSSILFNALLFLPLVLRKAIVFKAFGIAGVLFSAYFALAILVFFNRYLDDFQFASTFDTFVAGPIFVVCICLCSLSLFYAGTRGITKIK